MISNIPLQNFTTDVNQNSHPVLRGPLSFTFYHFSRIAKGIEFCTVRIVRPKEKICPLKIGISYAQKLVGEAFQIGSQNLLPSFSEPVVLAFDWIFDMIVSSPESLSAPPHKVFS